MIPTIWYSGKAESKETVKKKKKKSQCLPGVGRWWIGGAQRTLQPRQYSAWYYNSGCMSLYICQSVPYGLGVIIMWQCLFIDITCSTLVWDVTERLWGGGSEGWIGGTWSPLYFPLNFAVDLKLLWKTVYKKYFKNSETFLVSAL